MVPELRLIRYFVAVAQEGNVTRAAELLNLSQPSLSAAIKQLEQQLGVALLTRSGRGIAMTPAGEVLLARGRELLAHAEAVTDAVRERGGTVAARLRLGLTPTARHGVAPEFLTACGDRAPAVMLYTSEDTTGALLRDVSSGRLDLAVVFCAPRPLPDGLESWRLRDEPAVVHLRADHPLASRTSVGLEELAGEKVLIAAGRDSGGFTDRVLSAFEAVGVEPDTLPDPYPDLGLQAVREGLGIVVYARSAFPPGLEGSAFPRVEPPVHLPFDLVWRADGGSEALRAVLDAVRELAPDGG